ncbi:MAG: hypothetical protein ABIO05_08985 [Ferruginibacter sp.]
MRTCKFIIFFSLLISASAHAQDITGLWKGTLYNDTTQQYLRYELAISEEKGKLSGFSHTWFLVDDKQYYGIKKVKVKKLDGKIIVEDDGYITNNFPITPGKNVRQLNVLSLAQQDTLQVLTGPFSTNRTKEFASATGAIAIKHTTDYWQSSLIPYLQETGFAKQLSFVTDQQPVAKNTIAIQTQDDELLAREMERIAREKEAAELANVVVNKRSVETQKINSKKQKGDEKVAVAVNKKIITPVEVVKQPDPGIVKANPTRKKEKIEPVKKETAVAKVEKPLPVPIQTLPPSVVAKPVVTVPIVAINAAINVTKRNTELQQTVYFKSDSLQLSLFDNGEVDGDTVSVLMNGVLIFAKERLSTNAVRKMVAIDPSVDSVLLVMYAENLGSIPPNTGLLVVKDGRDIYEIRFNGDLNRNAAIVFRRRK